MLMICLVLAAAPASLSAQFKAPADDKGPRLDRETTARIRVGVVVKASGGLLHNIVATAPVPAEWPEQQVQVVNEDDDRALDRPYEFLAHSDDRLEGIGTQIGVSLGGACRTEHEGPAEREDRRRG